jgi:dihydroflavonol-4-reductase
MALTAFVTGSTGFVGTHLVHELVSDGWQVSALVREGSPRDALKDLAVEFRQGDVTDAESILRAMPEQVDAVFHVAASTNVWSGNNAMQTRVNVEGTRHVIHAAEQRGARRLVHTSSFIVWGFRDDRLTEESRRSDNADWINYVRTKWEAELLIDKAIERGLDAVILNPAHILGPGDRHNWSRVIRLVDSNKLPGVPPGGGAFADVREVARAHVQAFRLGRTGHRYLLGGEDTEFMDVIRLTGEMLGREVPRRPSPAWALKAVARIKQFKSNLNHREPDLTPESAAMITRHIHCDSGKAQRDLGYRFTPVETLLRDTITWMRENKLLDGAE